VHPHTDRELDQRLHVRINLLLKNPHGGCLPVLDGIPIAVGLGDAWVCLASRCRHATTPVEGPSPRSSSATACRSNARKRYLGWNMQHEPAAVMPA
jgi:hypothetical protein